MTDQDSPKDIKVLERAEHYIYLTAGFILVLAAGGLLITAVIEMTAKVFEGDYVRAMVHLLDRVLLVLMVAEIIYTVGRITRTQIAARSEAGAHLSVPTRIRIQALDVTIS